MRAALLLGILALSTPLSASWYPVFDPTLVRLKVGESTTVQVSARWSGIVDYGEGIHWHFRADDPRIAHADINVDDAQTHDVQIDALAPGITGIRLGGRSEYDYVRIVVTCDTEPPVRAAIPLVRAKRNEPAQLIADSEIASRTVFHWYAGAIDDLSHPLDGGGPSLSFTPTTEGVTSVWVQAVTPCSMSSAQFTVEVPPARRRAVRR